MLLHEVVGGISFLILQSLRAFVHYMYVTMRGQGTAHRAGQLTANMDFVLSIAHNKLTSEKQEKMQGGWTEGGLVKDSLERWTEGGLGVDYHLNGGSTPSPPLVLD